MGWRRKVDFILIIRTTPQKFLAWFRGAFGIVPDGYKEIPCQEGTGNNGFLQTQNPQIPQFISGPAVIRYESVKFTLNPVTCEYRPTGLILQALQIKLIPLERERIQVSCLSASAFLAPLVEDIFGAMTRTWQDFERVDTHHDQL
jgi:hypothetical protein